MNRVPPPRFDVEALHVRLRERIAELHPLVVGDVTRVFLEVSSLPCEQRLWSFEFAFDEDDGRIARLEARFAKHGDVSRSAEELHGYEVQLLLPRVIPTRPPEKDVRAARHTSENTAPDSLVVRFIRALVDLGAYLAIEKLEARSVEVDLL